MHGPPASGAAIAAVALRAKARPYPGAAEPRIMRAMPRDDAGPPDTARSAGSAPAAPAVLATERRRGERLGPEHLSALAPILGDARVGATLGGVRTPDDVARMLEQS